MSEIKKSKADIVFHLAAQPLVRYSYLYPNRDMKKFLAEQFNSLKWYQNYIQNI